MEALKLCPQVFTDLNIHAMYNLPGDSHFGGYYQRRLWQRMRSGPPRFPLPVIIFYESNCPTSTPPWLTRGIFKQMWYTTLPATDKCIELNDYGSHLPAFQNSMWTNWRMLVKLSYDCDQSKTWEPAWSGSYHQVYRMKLNPIEDWFPITMCNVYVDSRSAPLKIHVSAQEGG